MKRFIATILAILYFTATTGFVIHMHYCMGKIISANLWHQQQKKNSCSICGMSKKKGCCEDKHKIIKIDKKYDVISSAYSCNKVSLTTTYFLQLYTQLFSETFKGNGFAINSPPGVCKVPLYITNCVYRI